MTTTLLLTNDDGVTSPALIPLIRALEGIEDVGIVNTLVPDCERSWISKAVTRFEDIKVFTRKASEGEPRIMTSTGTPADCANLGIHTVFDERPDLVVAGINIGLNHGLAFVMSSGTVGAATEGVIAGLPAIAFSIGVRGGHIAFTEYARSVEGKELWQRSAEVAADIVRGVLAQGLPPGVDLLNVNFPREVSLATPRVVTEIAQVGYDALFKLREGPVYTGDYQGLKERRPSDAQTDLAIVSEGKVSITPLRLFQAVPIDAALREALGSVPAKT
ncbi:MAG: 5'/3'-nucleotidase SurE [Myxococcales bacterium]|nr:5'/3'-nucleotidase SurE [Myxococcales bacterium]